MLEVFQASLLSPSLPDSYESKATAHPKRVGFSECTNSVGILDPSIGSWLAPSMWWEMHYLPSKGAVAYRRYRYCHRASVLMSFTPKFAKQLKSSGKVPQ